MNTGFRYMDVVILVPDIWTQPYWFRTPPTWFPFSIFGSTIDIRLRTDTTFRYMGAAILVSTHGRSHLGSDIDMTSGFYFRLDHRYTT